MRRCLAAASARFFDRELHEQNVDGEAVANVAEFAATSNNLASKQRECADCTKDEKPNRRRITQCTCCGMRVQDCRFGPEVHISGDNKKSSTAEGCLDSKEIYTMGNFSIIYDGVDTIRLMCM